MEEMNKKFKDILEDIDKVLNMLDKNLHKD